MTAPLAALYPERYKSAACPENDAVLIIEPPCSIINGNKNLVTKNVPLISTAIILSNTSTGYSWIRPALLSTPALLKITSTRPYFIRKVLDLFII